MKNLISSLVLFPANKIKIKIKEIYGLEIIWEERKGNEYIIKVVQDEYLQKSWTFSNRVESLKALVTIQAQIQEQINKQKEKGVKNV